MTTSTKKPIYLDNQATTPVDKRVLEAMMPFFSQNYGNPHSNDHAFGWQAKKAVDAARKKVADFINVDSDEIIFTSGATEANNLAIIGALDGLKKSARKKIIVSSFEHKCILACADAAEKQGFEVVRLSPTREGFIKPSSLEDVMDDSVGLVSIMMVNNEIGTVQSIKDLSSIAHKFGALFHTDAAQAGVFLELDNSEINVDMLSLSGHKIYGPKGIGALFIKRAIQESITPIILGGGQENGFRSGTLPAMLCIGFGEACFLARGRIEERIDHLKTLSSTFLKLLHSRCPDIILNGSGFERHPGNLNIQFPGIDAHSFIQALQPHISAATGAACTTGTPEPSYVLRAIGLSEAQASSSVRFSFGAQNTLAEIRDAAEYVACTLETLDEAPRLSIA